METVLFLSGVFALFFLIGSAIVLVADYIKSKIN